MAFSFHTSLFIPSKGAFFIGFHAVHQQDKDALILFQKSKKVLARRNVGIAALFLNTDDTITSCWLRDAPPEIATILDSMISEMKSVEEDPSMKHDFQYGIFWKVSKNHHPTMFRLNYLTRSHFVRAMSVSPSQLKLVLKFQRKLLERPDEMFLRRNVTMFARIACGETMVSASSDSCEPEYAERKTKKQRPIASMEQLVLAAKSVQEHNNSLDAQDEMRASSEDRNASKEQLWLVTATQQQPSTHQSVIQWQAAKQSTLQQPITPPATTQLQELQLATPVEPSIVRSIQQTKSAEPAISHVLLSAESAVHLRKILNDFHNVQHWDALRTLELGRFWNSCYAESGIDEDTCKAVISRALQSAGLQFLVELCIVQQIIRGCPYYSEQDFPDAGALFKSLKKILSVPREREENQLLQISWESMTQEERNKRGATSGVYHSSLAASFFDVLRCSKVRSKIIRWIPGTVLDCMRQFD